MFLKFELACQDGDYLNERHEITCKNSSCCIFISFNRDLSTFGTKFGSSLGCREILCSAKVFWLRECE